MKKKLSLLLLICILNALSTNAKIYNGSCGENVNYSLNTETGLLSITGPGAMADYSSLSVPWYPNRSYIKVVEISDGVTSIGGYAFQHCSVTSVTIPNSVTSIGDCAFYNCSDLTSVTIPNSVTSIGDYAFYNCSGLTSVTIPNSVTSIGKYAFQSCSGLTSVTIPNSVTSIGNYAFDGTAWYNNQPDGLVYAGLVAYKYKGTMPENTSITIKEGTLGIVEGAFNGCSGLTSVTIPNSVTSIGDRAFQSCSGLISVTIPNSVTSIGSSAFKNCSGLTSISVENGNEKYDSRDNCNAIIETASNTLITGCKNTTIPNSVTSIGSAAFAGCSGLTSVTIPNSVTSIGSDAFSYCSGLTSIEIPNSVTSIVGSAFEGCSGLTSVTIPNSVTSIGNAAFHFCSGLTSVTIPNSVTSIGKWAFGYCSALTSVISKIEEPFAFGTNAFYGISSSCALAVPSGTRDAYIAAGWTTDVFKGGIEEIEIISGSCGTDVKYSLDTSTGVLNITGTGAMTNYSYSNSVPWYSNRSSIKSVEISDGVTSIGSRAFSGCSGLTSVTIPNSVTSIDSYAFSGCSGLTSVTIPNSVTRIGSEAFYQCSGLTSVTIGNSVTSIGSEAFYKCSGLTSVTIPNSVTSIEYAAFVYCSGLTSVTIGNSVTSIGASAFSLCSSLSSVTIPNSVTSIGASAFEGTAWYNNQPDGLVYAGLVAYRYKGNMPENTSITIKEGTLGIAGSAFSNCYYLSSVTIPNSVTSIGWRAFEDCRGLTSITIPNSVTSIDSYAFSGCSGLTSVTIPNSVTSIGYNAFQYCSGLTSVTIPNSVTSIESYAFEKCRSLTSVTIPNSVTSIGERAFEDCSKLTSVTIPNSVTGIGEYAFQSCSGLTSVLSEIEEPFAFGSSAFGSISSSCALTVPYGTRDAYIAARWTTDVFKGGIVEMDPDAMNINMSANEIGTYCSPYALDFSGVSGLKAYIMSGFSPSTSTLVLTPVTMVPAGTGLLLRGAEGNYEVPCTTTDMYYTNLLKGVTTATAIDPTDGEYTNFILSNGKHGIGFYTLSESGELAANKAYLQLPTASVASLSRAMRLVFADDITGIDEKKAETKKEDNIFYDLQGRRVDNPTQGLYIVNGKKVFINKY